MKYYYDLHIHTALSPCADEDMTPNNIVNMALLKGLDFIAITDHNHAGNVEAVVECARGKDIVVIPGMEVESAEEVHLLCLFPDVTAAHEMQQLVFDHLPDMRNRADIFGSQILYNSRDEIVGQEARLLLTATSLTVDNVKKEAEKLRGAVIPAHIDRNAFSIISNLGFISEDMNFTTIEVSKNAKVSELLEKHAYLRRYKMMHNSDAHHLGDISEARHFLELTSKSAALLLQILTSNTC